VADRVQQVAGRRGVTGSQIALAWVLSKRYVTSPIIGATRMEHLQQSLAALDIQLSTEELHELEEPYKLHPVLGHT
jgi:aryl-alcohol dehydrogenase-like predicted oxidoreductase